MDYTNYDEYDEQGQEYEDTKPVEVKPNYWVPSFQHDRRFRDILRQLLFGR